MRIERWNRRNRGVLPHGQVLIGETLVLRPLAASDLPHLTAWDNDPVIEALMGRRYAVVSAEEWYRVFRDGKDDLAWAVETKEGRLIGELELVDVNRRGGSAEVRICIGEKDCWSKGFGRESLQLILTLAFRRYGLQVVYLRVFESNARAVKLYERLGFRKEAILRPFLRRGDLSAVLLMSMTRERWQQHV